jgi:PAT family beta-lactamase induction signal transducer AmpG
VPQRAGETLTTRGPGGEGSPAFFQQIAAALSSRRTLSVTLLSFASGLPLGLVWIAIPDWLRSIGTDIRIVGLITLTHAPWTFKMLWSPLMDRYRPPFWGRRRGWILVCQVVLFALGLALAGVGSHPETPWVVLALALAIAFASASQDIAYDAYAVDVLLPEEQGVAVGLRTAMYRGAMYIAGALAITLAGRFGWSAVNGLLATLYLPMLLVTWFAPEPPEKIPDPRTLREAVWLPFLGFLSRHRALEILAFVLLYKLADNLSQSLLRPFLIDMGYNEFDRGVAMGTVGFLGTMVGTFLGGALTNVIGLGHGLWIFGFLQIFSNIGYILIIVSGGSRPLMYGAMGFETLTTGLGMGAFGVLLLRMTQKRFSATQYALFSSLFALPRLVAGPVTGFVVYAVGWMPFFWLTMVAGIPGLVLLQRFVPLGTRDPHFTVEPPRDRKPLSAASLGIRGVAGGIVAAAGALLLMAALRGLEAATQEGGRFDLGGSLAAFLYPERTAEVMSLFGALVFGMICGLFTAAVFAARHRPLEENGGRVHED